MTDPVVPTKKGNVLYWVSDIDPNALAQAEQTAAMPLYPTKADVLDGLKYEAEKAMDPILRRWFAIDLDPVDAERNAENAAVDLSWHLENVGLLNRPTLIDEEGVEHICDALIEVGPWDEIDGDGTEASIIADHIRDLPRLLAHDHARLTEEVRTLRLLVAINEASQIPDGHTRIDGKLFRLERHGDLNRYGLVRALNDEPPTARLSPPPGEPDEGEGER
jgi:hypothetical protein